MDIRTKLVFALVGVALGTMVALGTTMSVLADAPLREIRLNALDGRAQSMKAGLEQISQGWKDRVSLVASRTQLRRLLQGYNRAPTEEAKAQISQILADARTSVDIMESLAVFDAEDGLVASAGWSIEPDFPTLPTPLSPEERGVVYQNVSHAGGDSIRVGYAANLFREGERIGVLHARLDARALLDLTQDRIDLGDPGEVMVVVRDDDGIVRVLRQLGEGGPRLWLPVVLRGPQDPAALALQQSEGNLTEGLTDEFGEPIWAAFRYLPETDWGLVIKLKEEEARRPLLSLRDSLVELVLSLGAIAIVVGTILGFRFAKPIYDLARVADRIRAGTLSARAEVLSQDEVGYLARTFNEMAEEMEQKVTLLREFQRYFDVSLDMLCIAGTDGFFKRINPAFERILGWTEEELMAQSFLDFVDPEDLEETQEEIEKLSQGIPTISFENRYNCADGSQKRLAWTAYPEEGTGLIYAIARDITQQKEREEWAEKEIGSLRERLREIENSRRSDP
jgi:PAS domain S-box-containing protein